MLNLDYKCIEYAQKISKLEVDSLENTLRKALGVLQEDGIYAMFLWVEVKGKTTEIRTKLTDLLNEPKIKKHLLPDSQKFNSDFNSFCGNLKEIAKDLDKLLFVKKIIERTLIYALYHKKVDG